MYEWIGGKKVRNHGPTESTSRSRSLDRHLRPQRCVGKHFPVISFYSASAEFLCVFYFWRYITELSKVYSVNIFQFLNFPVVSTISTGPWRVMIWLNLISLLFLSVKLTARAEELCQEADKQAWLVIRLITKRSRTPVTAIGTLAKACSFTNCAVFICFGKIYVPKMIHPYFVACGISAPSFRRM